MRLQLLSVIFMSALGATLPPVAHAGDTNTPTSQAEHFETLKSLIGTYRETGEPEKAYTVDYSLISRDSAITEMWNSLKGRQELSVFHMNNGVLTATHYCASGAQSTLKLIDTGEDGVLTFKLRSISNLTADDKPHVSGFSYSFKDNTRIERSETWSKAGEESHSATTLVRLQE